MTALALSHAKEAAPWRSVLALLHRLHRVQQEFRVKAELSRFTDHQLADLGLTRDEIPAAARGTLRR